MRKWSSGVYSSRGSAPQNWTSQFSCFHKWSQISSHVRLFLQIWFLFPRTHAHTLTGNIEKVLFDALLKLSSQLRLNSAVKNQFPQKDLKSKRSASKWQCHKYRMGKKNQSLIPWSFQNEFALFSLWLHKTPLDLERLFCLVCESHFDHKTLDGA